MNVDVVVVGAGPAGSTVAGIVASEGLRVVVLERESEIGRSPCAGYVGSMDFPDIDARVIQGRVNGMRTYFPSGRYADFPISGFNVDRMLFDRGLAFNAMGCGAKFHVDSEVVSLVRGTGYSTVRMRDGREIDAKVVVGADGVSSIISRLLGFENEVVAAVQYEVLNCIVDPGVNEIYFGVGYAPGCYAWVFPTGRDSARVGLAVRSHLTGKRAADYLNEFIREHPVASSKFANSSKSRLTTGAIPVGGLHTRIQRENILLVGDSAGMADPVTGAGISYSMLAGRVAARAIVKAVKGEDLSFLGEYERVFRRLMDNHYQKSLGKRRLMDSITDNKSLEENLPRVWVTFEEYWRSD